MGDGESLDTSVMVSGARHGGADCRSVSCDLEVLVENGRDCGVEGLVDEAEPGEQPAAGDLARDASQRGNCSE